MQSMAREVRRLAPAYYVQTPNFWFPFEPHYRLPFAQYLPERARAALIAAIDRNPTGNPALEVVRNTRLISARKLAVLFPDAEIERERFLGLAKSLIAVRAP